MIDGNHCSSQMPWTIVRSDPDITCITSDRESMKYEVVIPKGWEYGNEVKVGCVVRLAEVPIQILG